MKRAFLMQNAMLSSCLCARGYTQAMNSSRVLVFGAEDGCREVFAALLGDVRVELSAVPDAHLFPLSASASPLCALHP